MKNIRQLILTALILALSFSFNVALGATFTVTTTADSGVGSLRQAIEDANGSAGLDVIEFNIPGAGPHSIDLTTRLLIKGGVHIDGEGLISIKGAVHKLFFSLAHNSIIKGLDLSLENSCSNMYQQAMTLSFSDNVLVENVNFSNTIRGLSISRSDDVTVKNCDFSRAGCGNDASAIEISYSTNVKVFDNDFTDHYSVRLSSLTDFLVTNEIPTNSTHYLVIEPNNNINGEVSSSLYASWVTNSTFKNLDYSSNSCANNSYVNGLRFFRCENISIDEVNVSNKDDGMMFTDCNEIDLINSDFSSVNCNAYLSLEVKNTTNFRASNNNFTNHRKIFLENLDDFLVTDEIPANNTHYLVLDAASGVKGGAHSYIRVRNVNNSTFQNFEYSGADDGTASKTINFSDCENLIIDEIDVSYGNMTFSKCDEVDLTHSNFSNSANPLLVRETTNFRASDNDLKNSENAIRLTNLSSEILITNEIPIGVSNYIVVKPEDGIGSADERGITFQNCNAVIDGVEFYKIGTPGFYTTAIEFDQNGGSYTVKNVVIDGYRTGIKSRKKAPFSITCSSFVNLSIGIKIEQPNTSLEVKDNSFSCMNRENGIINTSGALVIAEGNYWGDSSGSSSDGGTGTRYYGLVDALPFLTTASACAPVVGTPLVITASDISVCPGEEVVLGVGTQTSYLWSNSAMTQTTSVFPTEKTSYDVVITDTKGCKANASVTISIDPLLTLDTNNAIQTTTATGMHVYAVDVCGDLTGFSHNLTSTSGFVSTQLLASTNAGCQTVQITFANGVDWTLAVTNRSGCTTTLEDDDIVTVGGTLTISEVSGATNIIPETCIGTKDGAIDLDFTGGDTSCGSLSFSWTGPTGFTATTQNIAGLASGSYTITITDCSETSVTSSFYVNRTNTGGGRGRGRGGCKTALEELVLDFRLQPNPANDFVQVYFEAEQTTESFQIGLMDLAGRTLQQINLEGDGMVSLDVSEFPNGLYIVQLQANNQVIRQEKLIVVK